MTYSFIIPVYNSIATLKDTVSSVLSLGHDSMEVLLVDDGSTDGSSELCDSMKSDIVKVFHKENGGPGSARNVGLENAKGDFVIFVDSDDTINENYLKVSDSIMRVYPDIDIIVYRKLIVNSIEDIDAFEKKTSEMSFPLVTVLDPSYTIEENKRPEVCGTIIRRSLFDMFDTVRFPRTSLGEDLCLSLILHYLAKRVMLYDRPMYYYMMNGESISHRVTHKQVFEILDGFVFTVDTSKKLNIWDKNKGLVERMYDLHCMTYNKDRLKQAHYGEDDVKAIAQYMVRLKKRLFN